MNKFGFIPNSPDKRDLIAHHRSAVIDIKAPADYIPTVNGRVFVHDQGGLNSCVSNAILLALYIAREKDKKDFEEYSRLYDYWHARSYEGVPVVADDGVSIRNGCKAINKYGLSKERHWPYDEGRVNRNPGLLNRIGGIAMRDSIRFLRLTDGDICAQINSYVGSACPVIFGTVVGKSFLNYKRDSLALSVPDVYLGLHALLIVDYMAKKSGFEYVIANSWGHDYGYDGMCVMRESYIKWARSADFTILELK